jgi:hypothetical protein
MVTNLPFGHWQFSAPFFVSRHIDARNSVGSVGTSKNPLLVILHNDVVYSYKIWATGVTGIGFAAAFVELALVGSRA